jgi:hypothetical protein
MSNTVYLIPSVNETLQSLDLTDDQFQTLDAAMKSLSGEVALESRIVFADDTPSGGLRELDRNGWRIFFRYDPQQNAVMVADIRTKANVTKPKFTTAEQPELASIK